MTRSDVRELHYIAPIGNVPSILEVGILSHERASEVQHESIAMPKIQARRTNRRIAGGRNLHEYVNLYFDAHNPMLSAVRGENGCICVLRVKPCVLDMPDVVIADRNAASNYTRFLPVEAGLRALDRDRVYAQYWTHRDDPFEEMRHRSEKCAEVLVPDQVPAELIVGAFVANCAALDLWSQLSIELVAEVNNGLFF
ncbi:MAG: hypothetical protein AMXMBFR4_17570 [Candidatus Hydrogenedentota bacterium]